MSLLFTQSNVERLLNEAAEKRAKGNTADATNSVVKVFDYDNDDGAFNKRITKVFSELTTVQPDDMFMFDPTHPSDELHGKFTISDANTNGGVDFGIILKNLAGTGLEIVVQDGCAKIDPAQPDFFKILKDALVAKRLAETPEASRQGESSEVVIKRRIEAEVDKAIWGDMPKGVTR